MKKIIILVFLLAVSFPLFSQPLKRPKLVVGIVVDQMRWDYLYRFYDRYGSGGFRRLLREGFSCENTFIPYTPTVTAAGHTTVYTGSVPALHGIMSNNWYDREKKRLVYCTEDLNVQSVGSTSDAGKMSPKNLWANTVTDELRLATNFRNKTISIAMKDRASILPGGHSSNGSYWFDNATGGWISSSYYMQDLPDWIKKINEKHLPDQYLKKGWNTLYPIATYVQSSADSNRYEGRLEDVTFPHVTENLGLNKYESFRNMPQASTFTFETAKAALSGEKLGKGTVTDFLAVSFSATDYAGHLFGPNSIEVEDVYLRFDRDLADFLSYLDQTVGKGQYLVFMTADHGVAHNPYFLLDHHLPAGSVNMTSYRRQITDSLEKKFGSRDIIEYVANSQVYFNDSVIQRNKLDKNEIRKYVTDFLMRHPAVIGVVDLSQLSSANIPEKVKKMIVNGYSQKLSGDLQVLVKPEWFEGLSTGGSHSTWNPYDAHIPLLWFGWGIQPGRLYREVYMNDIAPTVSALLHIQMPNSSTGNVITEIIK